MAKIIWKYREGIDPNPINPNEAYPCYKSFRNVCRAWYGVAMPLLFNSVVLFQHKDSWTHLGNICVSPHLAQHVRRIQLVTSYPGNTSVYHRPKTLKQFAMGAGGLYTSNSNRSSPNGGPLAKDPYDLKSKFRLYKRWREGEEYLKVCWNRTDPPKVSFNLLLGLRKVETIGHNELAVIKKRYINEKPQGLVNQWRIYRNETRREVETGLMDDMSSPRRTNKWHVELFLVAFRRSGSNLSCLAIRDPYEMITGPDIRTILTTIRSLRRLELNLETYGEYRIYLFSHREQRLIADYFRRASNWVHNLDNLEELSITMRPECRKFADIFVFLFEEYFPRLKSLHLRTVRTTYNTLTAFLRRHRETIRVLRIDELY